MLPLIKIDDNNNKYNSKIIEYKCMFKKNIKIPEWKYFYEINKFSIDSKNNIHYSTMLNKNNSHLNVKESHTDIHDDNSSLNSYDSISDLYSEVTGNHLWCKCKKEYMNEKYMCKKCINNNNLDYFTIFIPEIDIDINCDLIVNIEKENTDNDINNDINNNPLNGKIYSVNLYNTNLSISYLNNEPFFINYENFFELNNKHTSTIFIDNIINNFKLTNKIDETPIDITSTLNVSMNLYNYENYTLNDCFKLMLDGHIELKSEKFNIELGLCETINLLEISNINEK